MIVLRIIWLFLPAYAANIAASVFKINFLNKPISEKYFGSHKTYRGFFFGTLSALIVSSIQFFVFEIHFFKNISYLNYSHYYLLSGFLLGFGALAGDTIKSYFKRRKNIAPGEKWIPFDQIDYTLGALFFIAFFWKPDIIFIFLSMLLNFGFHILFNHLGFWLGLRKKPW